MPWLCCYHPTPRSSANQPRAVQTVPHASTDELKPLVLHTQAPAGVQAPQAPPGSAGAPSKAGDKETAKRALQAADRHKAFVAFAGAGHSPGFGYTLALDRECNAYFGDNDALDDACYYAIKNRRAQRNERCFFP